MPYQLLDLDIFGKPFTVGWEYPANIPPDRMATRFARNIYTQYGLQGHQILDFSFVKHRGQRNPLEGQHYFQKPEDEIYNFTAVIEPLDNRLATNLNLLMGDPTFRKRLREGQVDPELDEIIAKYEDPDVPGVIPQLHIAQLIQK